MVKLHIWSLSFILYVNLVINLLNVLIWSLTFWYCAKMVSAVKCWMENIDVANGKINILFLCHLDFHISCHVELILKNQSFSISVEYIPLSMLTAQPP